LKLERHAQPNDKKNCEDVPTLRHDVRLQPSTIERMQFSV
jgi:hypothetical protein